MREEQDAIGTAKSLILEGYERLIDAYCNKVKQLYQKADENTKKRIINDLERLIEINNPEVSSFNPAVAKEIRKASNLSQKDLSIHLGISMPTVSRYENGVVAQHREHKTGSLINYLMWLKERNYNPYNL